MMKMLRILSLICVISSFEVSNKEETTKKVYLQNNDLGIYKKFVVASDVSYISEGTFNRLSVSGNFNKLPFANTFAVINGTAWKYSIYYAKKGEGVCDSYVTAYSFYHENDKDDVSVNLELSYSNLKSNYDKNTHGVGAIVTTDLEHGVSSSLSNSFNASSGVSINREAPSGVYSLYYVDIRCDAIIKAECNDDSQCKKTVYMYGKRVEKGLAIELSQGKPNNTYFPCC